MAPKKLGDELYKHGKEMFEEAKASTDPDLKRLAMEAARLYWDVDTNRQKRLSPQTALISGALVFMFAVGVCWRSIARLSKGPASLVCLATIGLALALISMILVLAGHLSENGFIRVVLSMWDKMVKAFSKKDSQDS